MACHLSGVENAVAACGTAFGDGHIRILRRLLLDNDMYSGKVIFTFDGDAAGQKAALRAFKENHQFTAATYVAIAPDNMDPCELRQNTGAEAVKALVDSAVPLAEFALRSIIAGFDLDTVEGRTNAMKACAPVLASLRDLSMRNQYVSILAGWLGVPDSIVRDNVIKAIRAQEVAASGREKTSAEAPSSDNPFGDLPSDEGAPKRPDPNDPILMVERDALKCLLQMAEYTTGWAEQIEESAYLHTRSLLHRFFCRQRKDSRAD